MELDEVPPDAVSYKQALRACRVGAGAGAGGRAADQALALIEDVRSKGLGPDVVSLECAARWVWYGLAWFGFGFGLGLVLCVPGLLVAPA